MKKQTNNYSPIIGMEIHAELKTASKMFCGCTNDPFGAAEPNIHTCPVCLGMPGGLPVANRRAIELTIKFGLALGCDINLFSKFDRKHYFYPDLPKGYQISQYDIPFCVNGRVQTSEGEVRIRRIHLEEDTGKLLHTHIDGEEVTLIDFNRGGVPLMEIVTEPDIHSASQAKEYAKTIRQLLRHLEIADCDMEQGGMRLEANISVRPVDAPASELPEYKVEVKNINSFRFLEQAILFETTRQSELLKDGATPAQETRGWNATRNETIAQRTKEDAEDYRYFPDPDLPPMRFTQTWIDELRASLPELPDATAKRWHQQYGIEERFGHQLTQERAMTTWSEHVLSAAVAAEPPIAANDLAKSLVNKRIEFSLDDAPELILERYRATTLTDEIDEATVNSIIDQLLGENADAIERYKAGRTEVVGFFIGQVKRTLGGTTNTKALQALIQKRLDSC